MSQNSNIRTDINSCKNLDYNNSRVKHPYEHKSDFIEIKKEIRDANGKVITEESNVKTCAIVKGLY